MKFGVEAIVFYWLLATIAVDLEGHRRYLEGCETAMTSVYRRIGLKKIDAASLKAYCQEKWEGK